MTGEAADDVFDNAPCGYLLCDVSGRILRVNSTLARRLGYQRESLRGISFSDLLTAAGRILYDTHFGPLLRLGGDLSGVTVDVLTSDQARLPMFLTANVALDADGRPSTLRIVVVDAADRRAYEADLLRARRRAEDERARAQLFAETLRRALLPPVLSAPDGLEAADHYSMASDDDVTGDFYDLFPLSRDSWGFFLGDVAGKGAHAAVVTALVRYTLRAAAVYDDDPVQVLHNLNAVHSQKLGRDRNRFCTVIYGRLNRNGNGFDVELASGGHLPPLLMYADGSAYYIDTTGGQAIGITTQPHFTSTRFTLAPGDTLLLYTDGITEASTGPGPERYDDEGALLRFARANSPTTADSIVAAVQRLLRGLGTGVEDDTAILALGVPRTKAG